MNSQPVPGACPFCGSFVVFAAPGTPSGPCPRCGAPQDGPLAAELRRIAAALAAVEAERHRLLARRAHLLASVRPGPGAAGPGTAGAWPTAPGGGETRRVDVQNVLLSLGGGLLAVAAIAFTAISWGHLGIGGRALVLAVLTLAAAAAPVALLRRPLAATAEVVACLGLVLLLLDAYALRRVALTGPGPDIYAAGATAVAAALWGGYAWLLRPAGERAGLRLPAPVALVLAQFPLPLAALAARSATALGAAFLADAAACTALAALRRPGRLPALRTTAVPAAITTGIAGLLVSVPMSLTADHLPEAFRAAALLAGVAVCAMAAALRVPPPADPAAPPAAFVPQPMPGGVPLPLPLPPDGGRPAPPHPSPAPALLPSPAARPHVPVRHDVVLGAVSGLTATVAAGGVVRLLLPDTWTVPGYAACALLLLAAAAPLRRSGRRLPPVAGAAAGQAGLLWAAALWAAGPLLAAFTVPLAQAASIWPPNSPPAFDVPGFPGCDPAAAVVTAAGVALALLAAAREDTRRAPSCRRAALALGTLAAAGLPVAVHAAHPAALALRVALAAALLLVAARHPGAPTARAASGAACAVALTAACWSLADRTETCTVLSVLTALLAAAAVPRTDPVCRAIAGTAAVACAAALAWAAPLAAGLPRHDAAFTVLAVAGLAHLAVSRRPLPAVEAAGCAAAVLAAVLASDAPGVLSALLGTAGLLAAAVALRADRRRPATAASAVLLLAAGWVRLAASGVHMPEAYTAPLSAVALGLGLLHRRRAPSTGSWAAYGPGLAVTLLPALAATWADPGRLRPLLLGTGALTVTLLGARYRLRAPLLLGGGVLALDALHELAPYVLQVLGLVPRWIPLALAGALLLAVGATYEHRLHDARRLRAAVRRLR